jgi:hypothetical protein
MALGFLKKLFGGGGERPPPGPDRSQAVEHKGFTIVPLSRPHNGQFLTAALIEKEVDGALKAHEMIRADTHGSADAASSFAITKAKQVIDEQGDRIFG